MTTETPADFGSSQVVHNLPEDAATQRPSVCKKLVSMLLSIVVCDLFWALTYPCFAVAAMKPYTWKSRWTPRLKSGDPQITVPETVAQIYLKPSTGQLRYLFTY